MGFGRIVGHVANANATRGVEPVALQRLKGGWPDRREMLGSWGECRKVLSGVQCMLPERENTRAFIAVLIIQSIKYSRAEAVRCESERNGKNS